MTVRRKDPELTAKREKMSSLLQELQVTLMQDINALFKEMIGTFVFLDAIRFNIRSEGQIVKKAVI